MQLLSSYSISASSSEKLCTQVWPHLLTKRYGKKTLFTSTENVKNIKLSIVLMFPRTVAFLFHVVTFFHESILYFLPLNYVCEFSTVYSFGSVCININIKELYLECDKICEACGL